MLIRGIVTFKSPSALQLFGNTALYEITQEDLHQAYAFEAIDTNDHVRMTVSNDQHTATYIIRGITPCDTEWRPL